MKSKYKKRILLGLLFVSFLLLTIVPLATYAVGNKDNNIKKNDSPTDEEVAKSLCTPDFIDRYYKISAEPIVLSNGVVTGIKIRAYKNNSITDTDLSFKVIKIGSVELYGNNQREIHPGTQEHPKEIEIIDENKASTAGQYFLEYSKEELDKGLSDDGNRFYSYVVLESIKGDSENDCATGIQFKVRATVGELGPVMDTFSYASDTTPPTLEGHKINFSNCDALDSFDKLICQAYQKSQNTNAFATGKRRYVENTGKDNWTVDASNRISLQCDYTQKFAPSELKFNDYYKNVQYMYAVNTYTKTGPDYVYHLINSTQTKHEPGPTCTVTCEEGVKVEYGPPVASKAGLCFEYKVRVTSHVNCYAEGNIPPMTKNVYKVCTPTASCIHASGYELDRAGPNEDFAACVQKCDGGKYSISCSKKCYKKVYGASNNNISNNLFSDYVDAIQSAEVDAIADSCGGKYGCYYLSGGAVQWAGKSTSGKNLSTIFTDAKFGSHYMGRYYITKTPWIFNVVSDQEGYGDQPYYQNCTNKVGYGFARKVYSGGGCCDAICSWVGCQEPYDAKTKTVNYYLNGGDNNAQIEADYKANLANYNKFVDSCNAAASCTTRSATFEISVDYKSGDTTKTIAFPYDEKQPNATEATNKDTLCSNGQADSDGCTRTYDKAGSTIIYDAHAEKIEAGKPITNIHQMHYLENPDGCYDPTQKVVLNPGEYSDSTALRIYRSTISFPGAWINYKTGEITYKPVSTEIEKHWEHIDDKFCIPREAKDVNTKYWIYYQGHEVCEQVVNTMNKDWVTDWNINAKINTFGLYGWNIDVSCFYALDEKDNTCLDEPKDVNTAYRIRSIDLEDMFPNTEGTETLDKSTTGREPGFNWSTKAIVNDYKNINYQSNPNTIINYIQTLNTGVYSPQYLDYEFNLDRNTLRDMRREINNNNYTDFDEEGFTKSEEAGIGFYYSERIRKLDGKNKYPDKAIIEKVCNNLKLKSNGEYDTVNPCEQFDGKSGE